MIVNHRPGRGATEYALAMDKIEFIAIQAAVHSALQLVLESSTPDVHDLGTIYAALDLQLHQV